MMQVLDKPDEKGRQNYELVVEGTNLLAILTTPGQPLFNMPNKACMALLLASPLKVELCLLRW